MPFKAFTSDLAIDLGTANTLISIKGKGIVLNQPSIIAIDRKTGKVAAVGEKARDMEGKTPENIIAIPPLREGVIADFEVCEKMLRAYIEMVHNRRFFIKPRAVIAVPSGITQVEKRAVKESAQRAGVSEVFLIEEPMAAAIGAGLPVEEPSGNMLVDIGGGTTEVAVISLAGIVFSKSSRMGGNVMDSAIKHYIRKNYNLDIGEREAEKIKMELGSALPLDEELTYEAKGRDLVDGIPKTLYVSSNEVYEALEESITTIIELIHITLENTPPMLAADIIDRGIFLTGGGANIQKLDLRIREETGLPVTIAEDPLLCVVRGAERVLAKPDLLSRVTI